MKNLGICLAGILFGYLLAILLPVKVSETLESNAPSSDAGTMQPTTQSDTQRQVSDLHAEVASLKAQIAKLESRSQNHIPAAVSEPNQMHTNTDVTEPVMDTDSIRAEQEFQSALAVFDGEATDPDWSIRAEQRIEDAFNGEANKAGIYFNRLECKTSRCYLELEDVSFMNDFERVFFEILEDKELPFFNAVITPPPSQDDDATTNYKVIFISEHEMN